MAGRAAPGRILAAMRQELGDHLAGKKAARLEGCGAALVSHHEICHMSIPKPTNKGKPSIVETVNGRWALLDSDGCIIRDDLSHAQAWDLFDWYDQDACECTTNISACASPSQRRAIVMRFHKPYLKIYRFELRLERCTNCCGTIFLLINQQPFCERCNEPYRNPIPGAHRTLDFLEPWQLELPL